MSELYQLMVNGILSSLRSLRVVVNNSFIKHALCRSSYTSRLRVPNLETFVLQLYVGARKGRRERPFKWTDLTTLISCSVMPRLREFSLMCTLQISDEINDISQSILFDNDHRNVRFQFALTFYTTTILNSLEVDKICNVPSTHITQYSLPYVRIVIILSN